MQVPRKISEAHPGSLSLPLPHPSAFLELPRAFMGSREKGSWRDRPLQRLGRVKDGHKSRQPQQIEAAHQIPSTTPWASMPCLRAGRPPLKALGPAAILCLDIPDTPQLKPHHVEAGKSCQVAGLRPWPQKEVGTVREGEEWGRKNTFRPPLGCGFLMPSRQDI